MFLISEITELSEGRSEHPAWIEHFTGSSEALGQLKTLRTRESLTIPTTDSNHPSVTLILSICDGHMRLENIERFRTMSTLSNISLSLNLAFLNENVHDLRVEQWFSVLPVVSQPLNDGDSSSFERTWDFSTLSHRRHKLPECSDIGSVLVEYLQSGLGE
jgi:hypothetical protein